MDFRPLITVIIPFYNSQHFLQEATESVICQEYDNWELVMVDDGSTDDSTTIAETYVIKEPHRIKLVKHPGGVNKGLCASRNLGLKYANGEYIALLDSDDVWTKNKLQNQVELIARHPECGMLCESSLYWHSWASKKQKDKVVPVGIQPETVYTPTELILSLYPLRKGATPCPSSLMLKRSTVVRLGGFVEEFVGKYSVYEDQAFFFKLYLEEPVFVSASCNNWYRIRPDSLMSFAKDKEQYRKVRMFFLKWALSYLKSKNIEQPKVASLIKQTIKEQNAQIRREKYKRIVNYLRKTFRNN